MNHQDEPKPADNAASMSQRVPETLHEDEIVDPKTGESREELSEGEQAFEVWRKRGGAILTPIAFALTYYLCDGLTPEGRKLAAILVAIAMLWVSEVIPLAMSALLGAVLCVVFGVGDAKTVLASFADPIVFVFIGGFMLARAMMLHGLDRRIALGFLAIPWVGSHPARIMAGLGVVTALLSMWVSNSATTAMMLPIGLGILSTMHQMRVREGTAHGAMDLVHWPFATGMMLMIAYSASIGGVGTPVGSPPNLIGLGLIKSATGVNISFFQWMALAIPLLMLMGPALFGVLYLLHRPDRAKAAAPTPDASSLDAPTAANAATGAAVAGASAVGGARSGENQLLNYIHSERRELGPWTAGQRNTLFAFAVAVVLWVTPGVLQLPWFGKPALGEWMNTHMPESIVALIAAILLFVLPVNVRKNEFTLSWPEAVKIDWGTVLLFGGGLALGSLMFKTGVAEAMGKGLTDQLGFSSLWALTGLSIALAILISEAASNTASATMIIPVVIAIAQGAGVSPLPPALGACIGASFGFMLPVSTPPNAIAYGSGLIPLPKMMRAGIIFDVLGFFLIWAGLRVLCPLLGLA